MSEHKPNKDADLRSFHSFLLKLEGGALNEEITDKMRQGCALCEKLAMPSPVGNQEQAAA